jgi:hypothetical protein
LGHRIHIEDSEPDCRVKVVSRVVPSINIIVSLDLAVASIDCLGYSIDWIVHVLEVAEEQIAAAAHILEVI